jgi:hypothetical protein
VKNVKITLRTSVFTNFCTLAGEDALRNQELERKHRSKSSRGKITKSGGSAPTFRAFIRPKSVWGRSRPSAYSIALVISPRLRTVFSNLAAKDNHHATD